MLAERKSRGRPMVRGALSAALVLGFGLAGSVVGSTAAVAATGDSRIAVVVPLTVPATEEGLLSAESLEVYTAPDGVLTQQLDAVAGRTVAVGVDPRILASIRVLGTSAPASARAWLDQLAAMPNETFALAWADTDLTLASQAGLERIPVPAGLDYAIDPALFAAVPEEGTTPAPTPTATPDPTVPVIPTLPTGDDLTAFDYTLPALAWPRDDTVIGDDLDVLVASGYTSALISSSNLVRDVASPVVSLEGITGVVSDAPLSASFRSAVSSSTLEPWTLAMETLNGALDAGGDRIRVVTLDREVPVTGGRLSATLTALEARGTVELVTVATAEAERAVDARIEDSPQEADHLSRVERMFSAEAAERRFITIAERPADIAAERRLDLLARLSAVWASTPEQWSSAANTFVTESRSLRNSVYLVESSALQLFADNGQYLPVTVSNELDQAVTVYITVRPETALLVVDETDVELTIAPGSQAKTNVPVHSLSNGVVDVETSLESGDGVSIGPAVSAEVNVQAGWETPIVVAFATAVVLVFGAGILRTVIKRRRAKNGD